MKASYSIEGLRIMYEIDKKDSKPTPRGKYPFKSMEVGDSFFVPNGVYSPRSPGVYINAYTLGSQAIPNSKWCARTLTENGVKGLRIWRVK